MIDMEGNSHIIRKRETLDSIEKDEIMPKYLKNFKL